MKQILFLLAISAGCVDSDASPVIAATGRGASWVCYTHASCSVYDNAPRNKAVHVCLVADRARDALEPGEAAASSWASEWRGACAALEGTIGGPEEGHVCATANYLNPSTYDPAAYGCDVSCEPLFEGC